MNLTMYIWTGRGASRLDRAPTFAGGSRSSNVSLVQEDTRVSQTTARSRPHVLSLGLDVLREVAEWMDRQRAVWGRFMDVVDEYLKEEGAK